MYNLTELSKIKKNSLKNNIKNILYNNTHESIIFNELIKENLNIESSIKYIIKIISYYAKNETNQIIKTKCFELFLELIKYLSQNYIIKNITNILLFLQDNITIFKIHISFEIILSKLNDEIEIKIFEVLNGFCIINMKKEDNITKKEALICYQSLIKNFENFIDNSNMDKIINSFLDTLTQILLNKNYIFEDRYLLLIIVNDIICLAKEKCQNLVEIILIRMIDDLLLNDNIKINVLNIINNIIKFCPNKRKEIKEVIHLNLEKLSNDKFTNNMIKRIIYDINTNIGFNKSEDNQIIQVKKAKINRSFYKNKNNNRKNNKKNKENNNKSFEIDDFNKNKKIKCQIYVNEKYIPINRFKNHLNTEASLKKENLIVKTFRKEEDYLNPIKLWYNFDSNNSINKQNKKKNIPQINFEKTFNNNHINIINQIKDERKLDLIMNQIIKLSNNQNIIAEKIINLDKNTQKHILYFEERLNQLENKDINDELINKRCRILYPSNKINKKIIDFLTIKNNEMAIYYLKNITDFELESMDNNLIEDVFDKLIFFIQNKNYVEETVTFIKKLFIKIKRRLSVNIIKKLLASFDLLLTSGYKLSEQISFDISLIISSINISKI